EPQPVLWPERHGDGPPVAARYGQERQRADQRVGHHRPDRQHRPVCRHMSKIAPFALAASLIALAGCGGGDDSSTPAPMPAPPARLAPPLNVQRCLNQVVYPGRTVANSVVPDTIKIDLSQPAGFPNGRRLTDQVIDTEFAWLFLDVASQGV